MTFDRYVLRSYLYVFTMCFVSTFGLMVVIDLLDNVDDFLTATRGLGPVVLLGKIVEHYAYQSIFFVARAGAVILVLSAMVVLILLQRSKELHPLLAAGVPMYRILWPIVAGSALLNVLLIVNQELLVPKYAHKVHEARGATTASAHIVESIYDHSTRITIDADSLFPAERALQNAQFVLPAPDLVDDLTILKAKRAKFCPATGNHPDGWLLTSVAPPLASVALTTKGESIVRPVGERGDAFVATPVRPDQLYRRASSYSFLSTREILGRIRSPAYGPVSVSNMVVELHSRLTQPFINLVAVLLAIPIMVRKESRGLVLDAGVCGLALGLLFGLAQGALYLSRAEIMPAELAAWLPVIVGGTMSAWLSWMIRT